MSEQLRQRRLRLQREIADAFQEQNRYWSEYVRPHSATALMGVSALKGSKPGAERTLTLQEADLIDRSTPTGAFEYGRAYVQHYSELIRQLRRQLAKVEDEQRKAADESWRQGNGDGQRRTPEERSPGLPGPLGERLVALRRLVHDARGGGKAFQRGA